MNNEVKKFKIFILSFDWRNIFENNFDELKHKLKRNRMGVGINNFYFVSWSTKTYFKKRGSFSTSHFRAWPFRNRVFLDFLLIFKLSFLLLRKKMKPDLIWGRDFGFFFSGVIAKLICGCKLSLTLGATPDTIVKTKKFSKLQFFYQKFSELVTKRFIDFYFANGENTKNYLLKIGIPEEKINILTSNTIEQDIEFINNAKKGEVRKELNIAKDKKIALYVGRLEPEKGLFLMLDSFAQLGEKDLVLLFVGNGRLEESLKEKARELGVGERVFFVGHKNRKEIWKFFLDSQVFLFFSKSEGVPSVVKEAMYMELPVIASRIDGVKELIGKNEERGLYWDKRDGVEELGRKIMISIDNNKRKIALAKEMISAEIKNKKDFNFYFEHKL